MNKRKLLMVCLAVVVLGGLSVLISFMGFSKNKTSYVALRAKAKTYQSTKKRNEMMNTSGQAVKVNVKKEKSKIVYLTFDDGPNELTPKLLKMLDKHNVKATFFMIGKNIKKYNEYVKMAYEDGQTIGLHSMTHENRDMYKSSANLLKEMNDANEELYKAIGVRSKFIRIPYGSYPYVKNKSIIEDVEKDGYVIWDWNLDSGDSLKKYKDYRYDKLCEKVIDDLQKFKTKTPIILMHERGRSLNMVPKLIVYLLNNGYDIEPITDKTPAYNFWIDRMN